MSVHGSGNCKARIVHRKDYGKGVFPALRESWLPVQLFLSVGVGSFINTIIAVMTGFFHRFAPVVGVLAIWAFVSLPVCGQEPDEGEKRKRPMGERPRYGDSSAHREKWEKLSEEEREKLKLALREVWADPAVLSAREEVNEATQAFQDAIRVAMTKADPEVAALLKEVQTPGHGPGSGRPHGRPGGPGMPKRMGDTPTGPPAFFEKMTPEEREHFRKVELKAREAESVVAIRKELEGIQKEDDQLRRKRMEVYRKMRKAVLNAMVKEDPSLAEKISELGSRRGSGPKSGPRMKGKKPDGTPPEKP